MWKLWIHLRKGAKVQASSVWAEAMLHPSCHVLRWMPSDRKFLLLYLCLIKSLNRFLFLDIKQWNVSSQYSTGLITGIFWKSMWTTNLLCPARLSSWVGTLMSTPRIKKTQWWKMVGRPWNSYWSNWPTDRDWCLLLTMTIVFKSLPQIPWWRQ